MAPGFLLDYRIRMRLPRSDLRLLAPFVAEMARSVAIDPLQALSSPRYFLRWRRTLPRDFDPVASGEAEIPFCVADWLGGHLRPGMQAFEWGAGGSTIFWARRGLGGVTVEHDRARAEAVARGLKEVPNRDWQLQIVATDPYCRQHAADPGAPADYASGVLEGRSFKAYVSVIDAFPDHSFDLIVVKGRSRPACVVHALNKLKPGGCLLLCDATNQRYDRVVSLADREMPRRDLLGPVPCERRFSVTYIWEKPIELRGAEEEVLDLSPARGEAT